MRIYIQEATVARVNEVIKLARETDKLEAYYMCGAMGKEPATVLSLSTLLAYANSYRSECVYAEDGTPLMVYGFIFNNYNKPDTIWAVCTNHVEDSKYKRTFIVESRRIIQETMETMPDVANLVWSKNKLAIKWLRYVGANIYLNSVQCSNEQFLKFKFNGGQVRERLLTKEGD